jgi:hypothetical protein
VSHLDIQTGHTEKSRWLLLLFQIPAQPSYLRVKIRRRLQRLGAVAVKQAVYALSNNKDGREDFEWLRTEIESGGGEASVCEAHFVAGLTDLDIEEMFRAARETDYRELSHEAAALRETVARGGLDPAIRRSDLTAELAKLRARLDEIAAVDFFAADGREAVVSVLEELDLWVRQDSAAAPEEGGVAPMVESNSTFRGRTWITRQGVFVDRMASAWFIRRFVDPDAEFRFVPGRQHEPACDEIRFDMSDAEFTHKGDRCTFEVLLDRFAIDEPALRRLAEIVHDLDLKDSKFGRPESVGIGAVLRGIVAATDDDADRINRGAALFDELLASFAGVPEKAP